MSFFIFNSIKVTAFDIKNYICQTDAAFIKRFRAEAQAAGSLSHTNIVSIYDVAQDGDLDYIVMEYVDGISAKKLLNSRGGMLDPEFSLDILQQVAVALKYVNANGLILPNTGVYNEFQISKSIKEYSTDSLNTFPAASLIPSITVPSFKSSSNSSYQSTKRLIKIGDIIQTIPKSNHKLILL